VSTRAKPTIQLFSRTGDATGLLDEYECEATVSRQVNSEWSMVLTYPVPQTDDREDKSSLIEQDGRMRIIWIDGTYDTFRISRLVKARKGGVPVYTAHGEHVALLDLNSEIIDGRLSLYNYEPSDALTALLAYSTNWSSGGTTGLNGMSNLTVEYETVMSGLQRICEAAGAEYDVDEAAGTIELRSSLGSSNNVLVRSDRNAKSMQHTRYSRNVVNKMYGIGGGSPVLTIAGARHIVYGYDSGTGVLTVGREAGGYQEGFKVVAEDDSWNTYKVKFITGSEAGNSFTITDSAKGDSTTPAGDTLTIDDSLSVSQGDKFVITDASDNEVAYIRAGSSISSYGTVEGVHRDARYFEALNLVETPALDGTYAAGLCGNWTKEGAPTVAEETTADYVNYGASSQKVTASGDAQGVSQQVSATSGRYYTAIAWVYVSSGTVKLQLSDGTSTWESSKSDTGWSRYEIQELSAGATLTIKVLADGGAATFYVDAVQITEGVLSYGFTANDSRKSLWDVTYDALQLVKDPQVEYQVSFHDLYRVDPERYADDEISLGDTVEVQDDELGIDKVSLRVRGVRYDVFRPERTTHTVSNIED